MHRVEGLRSIGRSPFTFQCADGGFTRHTEPWAAAAVRSIWRAAENRGANLHRAPDQEQRSWVLHLGQTVQTDIDAFIEACNVDAKPLIWTARFIKSASNHFAANNSGY
jgi:hypothetical protein